MSENPYSVPQEPPFGADVGQKQVKDGSPNPLMVPAILLIVFASLWIAYGILNIGVVLVTGPPEADPGQPPEVAMATNIGFYSAAFLLPVFSLFTLAGGIQMLRLKMFSICVAGAITSLIPLCGPCFGLTLPIGIWALVLLFRPDVKQRFR